MTTTRPVPRDTINKQQYHHYRNRSFVSLPPLPVSPKDRNRRQKTERQAPPVLVLVLVLVPNNGTTQHAHAAAARQQPSKRQTTKAEGGFPCETEEKPSHPPGQPTSNHTHPSITEASLPIFCRQAFFQSERAIDRTSHPITSHHISSNHIQSHPLASEDKVHLPCTDAILDRYDTIQQKGSDQGVPITSGFVDRIESDSIQFNSNRFNSNRFNSIEPNSSALDRYISSIDRVGLEKEQQQLPQRQRQREQKDAPNFFLSWLGPCDCF